MDTVAGSFFSHKTILSLSFPLLFFCPDVPKCGCAPSALRSFVQRGGKFALFFFFSSNSCLCEASYWNQPFYACTEHFITTKKKLKKQGSQTTALLSFNTFGKREEEKKYLIGENLVPWWKWAIYSWVFKAVLCLCDVGWVVYLPKRNHTITAIMSVITDTFWLVCFLPLGVLLLMRLHPWGTGKVSAHIS